MKVIVSYTKTVEEVIEIDDKFQALADPDTCPDEGVLTQELVNLVIDKFCAMPNLVAIADSDELLLEI